MSSVDIELLIFPMSRVKWFEFEVFEGILINGGDLSLKVFFCLKRDVKGFEDVRE